MSERRNEGLRRIFREHPESRPATPPASETRRPDVYAAARRLSSSISDEALPTMDPAAVAALMGLRAVLRAPVVDVDRLYGRPATPPASEQEAMDRDYARGPEFDRQHTPPASETVDAALHRAWVEHGGDQYYGLLFWDEVVRNIVKVEAAIRAEADERVRALREAAQAYVDWQYQIPGARRFTLTDLRAALDAAPEDAHKPQDPRA